MNLFQQFKIAILDHAISTVNKRFTFLFEYYAIFCFMYEFRKTSNDDLMNACTDLDIKVQVQNEGSIVKDIDAIFSCKNSQLRHHIVL